VEDVLEVEHRPSDMQRPEVCLDEISKPLLADTCERVPMKPGWPARFADEDEHKETCSLLLICEPATFED